MNQQDEQVPTALSRLVDRYPVLFGKLVGWLNELDLYGRFTLHRHGTAKVTFEVTRTAQESESTASAPNEAPRTR